MRRTVVLAALAVAGGWIGAPSASAVCRVVEPYEDSGTQPVTFDPTTAALFVVAPDQIVDYDCPEPAAVEYERTESGIPRVPLSPPIAGDLLTELGASLRAEAGFEAPEYDPSLCYDGSVGEPIRDTIIHTVVRPAIYASGGSAGLIMPIPTRADVNVAPDELFTEVSALQRAHVEETITFVEDQSLGWQCSDPHYSSADTVLDAVAGAPMMLMGCGGDASGDYYRPGLDDYETETVDTGDGVVMLERIATTDSYEVVVLNASSIDALLGWLDENEFAHDAADENAFAAYVDEDAWFVALKVTPEDLDGERVALAPLIVSYRGEEVPVMNRLQYDPIGGMMITDAYVLAPTPVEAADGDGTTLYSAPVDFETAVPMLAGFGLASGWLTRIELVRRMHQELEDTVLAPAEHENLVRPLITRTREVRVAAACCPGNAIPAGSTNRRFTEQRSYLQGEEPDDSTLFYRAPAPEEMYCSGGDEYAGGPDYYACSVDDRRTRTRLLSLGSWIPVLLVFGSLVWRARRRRRR